MAMKAATGKAFSHTTFKGREGKKITANTKPAAPDSVCRKSKMAHLWTISDVAQFTQLSVRKLQLDKTRGALAYVKLVDQSASFQAMSIRISTLGTSNAVVSDLCHSYCQ